MSIKDWSICFAGSVFFAIFLSAVLPPALDREERRLEIVREYNCEHYGAAMDRWAMSKGMEPPCQN